MRPWIVNAAVVGDTPAAASCCWACASAAARSAPSTCRAFWTIALIHEAVTGAPGVGVGVAVAVGVVEVLLGGGVAVLVVVGVLTATGTAAAGAWVLGAELVGREGRGGARTAEA